MPLITLSRQGWQFAAADGASLLEAAEAAGIVLPSSCRNGSCRTCYARVLDGQYHHRIDWPSLSPEERQQAWVLPCVCVADSDLLLDIGSARRAP